MMAKYEEEILIPTLDVDDARLMLFSCSAFVNYVKAISSKGGG